MSGAGGIRNARERAFMECLVCSGCSTTRSETDPIGTVIPVVLNCKENLAQGSTCTWGTFLGHKKYLEEFLIVMTGNGGLPLASHGWKLGILLSILQWRQDGPHNEELSSPGMPTVSTLRSPGFCHFTEKEAEFKIGG